MKKRGTWLLISMAGVVFISIGILSLVNPLDTYIKLAKYSGISLLLNAVFLLLASFFVHANYDKEKTWMFLEGIVDFTFGIFLFINPLLSFIIFPYLIGCWILSLGIIKIVSSLLARKYVRGWIFILFIGILAVAFSMMIIYVPYARSNYITLFLGIFGITMGILLIFESFRFRKAGDALNLMF